MRSKGKRVRLVAAALTFLVVIALEARADAPVDDPVLVLSGHEHGINSIALSEDLIVSGGDDDSVRVWSARDGKPLRTLKTLLHLQRWKVLGKPRLVRNSVMDEVDVVAISPADRDRVASVSCDGNVRIWSIAKGKMVDRFRVHEQDRWSATSLVWSPGGDLVAVAVGSCDIVPEVNIGREAIQVWSVKDHTKKLTFGATTTYTSLAFSPDGKLLAAGNRDRTVRIWSVEDGRLAIRLGGVGGAIRKVAFSPCGDLIATSSDDRRIRLFSPADGRLVRTIDAVPGEITGPGIMDLAFSPSGDVIASAVWDKVQLWSVRDGALTRTLRGIGSSIWAIAFSPAGDRLAGGASDKVLVWNLEPPRTAPRDDSIGLTGAVKGTSSR